MPRRLSDALTLCPARPRKGDRPGDRYFRQERTRIARDQIANAVAPFLFGAIMLSPVIWYAVTH